VRISSAKTWPARSPNLAEQATKVPVSAGAGILTDSRNGLMWQQNITPMHWYDAHAKVQTLDTGGHTDWRMPELAEITLLLNGWRDSWLHLVKGANCEHKWLTALGFTGVDEGAFANGWVCWRDINYGPDDWYHDCGTVNIWDGGFSDGMKVRDNMPGVNFWAVRGQISDAGKVQK